MALCKCIVETVNTSGTVTEARDEKISSSSVTRWGKRTVDEGKFQFSINTKIDENYNVKYLQDIVDLDLLVLMDNFQLTTFDESGYNMNPAADLIESRFINPNGVNNTKKFQSQYILKFDESTSTDFYDIPDHARLDMTGQFDLYIWCQFSSSLGTYTTGEKAVIFSKYDAAGGAGHAGIEVGFEHQASGDKRLWVRFLPEIGSLVDHVGTEAGFVNNTPRLIRIKRDENNDVKCYLDGIFEFEFNTDDAIGGVEDIRIGAHQHPTTPSEFWGGHLMQIRLYAGGYFSDDESERIMLNSPQPMTMKLSGKCWKVDDNTNPKTAHVKGNGKTLVETNLTSDILSGTDTTPNRTENVYDAAGDNFEIIDDIFENVDSSFSVKDPNSAANASHIGRFVATGSLLQCIELLLLESDAVLFTAADRIVVIEDSTGITTPFKFEQGSSGTTPGFVITNSGKDDALLVNQLELVGRIKFKKKVQTFITTVNPETEVFTEFPISVRVVEQSGGLTLEEGTDYDIDFEGKTITFTTTADTFDVEYDYEDLSSTGLYFRNITTGSSSVTQYGKYARRIFIPQLTDQADVDVASQRIIGDNKDVLTRYEVIAPVHLNHVRENHNILLVNSIKSINTTETIQSITWKYPSMRTIIQLGEYRFDAFDMENIDSKDIAGAKASTFKTQNT